MWVGDIAQWWSVSFGCIERGRTAGVTRSEGQPLCLDELPSSAPCTQLLGGHGSGIKLHSLAHSVPIPLQAQPSEQESQEEGEQ